MAMVDLTLDKIGGGTLVEDVTRALGMISEDLLIPDPVTGKRVIEIKVTFEVKDRDDGLLSTIHEVKVKLPIRKRGGVTWLRRWGTEVRSTIFCDKDGFVLLLEDSPEEPGRERITYLPRLTEQGEAWLRIDPRKRMSHVDLKKFVTNHEPDIDKGNGLLTAVSQFSSSTSFTYMGNLGKGGSKNINFATKTAAGSGSVDSQAELPTEFTIRIPIIAGWDLTYVYTVRLDWDQRPGEAPTFALEVTEKDEQMAAAIFDMVEHTRRELNGDGESHPPANWLVVQGKPQIEKNPGT